MSCWHYYAPDGGETAFSIEASRIVFGRGALGELGDHARAAGCKRVALFTDQRLARGPQVARAREALAGLDVAVFEEVKIEPTDVSFLAAARFAAEGKFDGYVSVGGGSLNKTAKAAALYTAYPAPFLRYVNKPGGEGAP